MALTLPDGWKRWRFHATTVVSGEIGLVVTGVTDCQVVLMGAIVATDLPTVGSLTISDGTNTSDLDFTVGQSWLTPNDEGHPGPVGASMTYKVDATTTGYIEAWGFIRPSASVDRYTGVASIA